MKMLARNHRITPSKRNILIVYQSPPTTRHRNEPQIWGGLNKAWLGYVIAKSEKDYEKNEKYTILQKFERRVNIEINEFLSLNFVLLVTLIIKRKMMIQSLQ
jgi:hypothetical protein